MSAGPVVCCDRLINDDYLNTTKHNMKILMMLNMVGIMMQGERGLMGGSACTVYSPIAIKPD